MPLSQSDPTDSFLLALERQARQISVIASSDYHTPGELAMAMDTTTVQTPALDILDAALVEVDVAVDVMLRRRKLFARLRKSGMDEDEARLSAEKEIPSAGCDRLIISMPPQEGKSERATHYGVLWMLRRHPELRVAIVSYEERIAQRMSYLLRNDIETFDGNEGNFDVGLRLRKDNRSVGSWNLDGERGSVYAIGIGGAEREFQRRLRSRHGLVGNRQKHRQHD